MPSGNVTADGGELALQAEPASVPYAAALSACRSALSAALLPAGSNGSVFEDVDNPINLFVPRYVALQGPCGQPTTVWQRSAAAGPQAETQLQAP